MKISEMIKNLQEFMVAHGVLKCWYSVDDEGNEYQEVYYTPSKYYIDEDGTVYTGSEDVEECGLTLSDVRPICIVN